MKPEYPKNPIPEGFNCWIYDKKTGEIFPGEHMDGMFWDENGIVDASKSQYWELMFDPKVDKFFVILSIITITALLIYRLV